MLAPWPGMITRLPDRKVRLFPLLSEAEVRERILGLGWGKPPYDDRVMATAIAQASNPGTEGE